jgi:hypothetical protein
MRFPAEIIIPGGNKLFGLKCIGNSLAQTPYPKFLHSLNNNNLINE